MGGGDGVVLPAGGCRTKEGCRSALAVAGIAWGAAGMSEGGVSSIRVSPKKTRSAALSFWIKKSTIKILEYEIHDANMFY